MNPTLRRILSIALFVAITVGIGYLIYVVFFKPIAPPGANNAVGNVNGLPTIGNGNGNFAVAPDVNALPIVNGLGPQPPSDIANGGPTFTSTVNPNVSQGLTNGPGDLRFYDRTLGQFFKLSPDGLTKELLTDAVYREVQDIDWSPDGNQAILTFPDNNKILYNFADRRQTTLPKELNDFAFSPQSDKIVAKFLDGSNLDNQWLMVSRPDGSQSSTAEHLGENADQVKPLWSPNNQIIATFQDAVDDLHSDIIFLGQNGENFKSATVNGRGFDPKWAPDGRRMLYSVYSQDTEDNPHLYLMNASPESIGTGNLDLGLDTSADKCTFSGSGVTLYCAVPYYYNPGSGPAPDLSAGIPDNIYIVDLLRGSSTLIARPVDQNLSQRFSAYNLRLSPQEDYLYFTDALTGTLEKIQLR